MLTFDHRYRQRNMNPFSCTCGFLLSIKIVVGLMISILLSATERDRPKQWRILVLFASRKVRKLFILSWQPAVRNNYFPVQPFTVSRSKFFLCRLIRLKFFFSRSPVHGSLFKRLGHPFFIRLIHVRGHIWSKNGEDISSQKQFFNTIFLFFTSTIHMQEIFKRLLQHRFKPCLMEDDRRTPYRSSCLRQQRCSVDNKCQIWPIRGYTAGIPPQVFLK